MPYTITYRTAGDWGAGKGADLTAVEVDESFYSISGRLDALEGSAATPNGIANITQSGTTISIVLDDSTTFGPFDMPRPAVRPTVTSNQAGATLTPVVGQENYYFRCSNVSGCAVTIPDNATEAFAVDTEMHFRQVGAGPLTFTWDTGITVNVPTGFDPATDTDGAVVTLKKVDTDEWDLFGHLAEYVSG